MNKAQLVEEVAVATDLPKNMAAKALDAVLDGITNSLVKREDVSLVGFGTFAAKDRAARTGRNPKTGEPIEISASVVASFKAGKGLKEAVNR